MVCPAETLVELLPSAPLTMPWGRRRCTTRTGHPCASAQQRNKESISISRMAPTHRKPRCLNAACVVLMACQVQLIAAIRAAHRVIHRHALALDDHHLARPRHAAGCQCDLMSIQVLDLRRAGSCSVYTHVRQKTKHPSGKGHGHCRTSIVKPTRASTRDMFTLWCRSDPRRSNVASGAVTMTNCAQKCRVTWEVWIRILTHRDQQESYGHAVQTLQALQTTGDSVLTFRSPGSPSTVGSPCSKNEISCRPTTSAQRPPSATNAYDIRVGHGHILHLGSLE